MLRRPLWPAAPPPRFTRTLPGTRSSSSWNAVIASVRQLVEGGRLLHRLAGGVHVGQRFQSQDFSPATLPSAVTPLNRRRHGEKPWRMAITSSAMKPILWRLPPSRLWIAEADPELLASPAAACPARAADRAPERPRAAARRRGAATAAADGRPPSTSWSAARRSPRRSRGRSPTRVLGALQVVPADVVVEVERRDRR